jgi:hypothetical protein
MGNPRAVYRNPSSVVQKLAGIYHKRVKRLSETCAAYRQTLGAFIANLWRSREILGRYLNSPPRVSINRGRVSINLQGVSINRGRISINPSKVSRDARPIRINRGTVSGDLSTVSGNTLRFSGNAVKVSLNRPRVSRERQRLGDDPRTRSPLESRQIMRALAFGAGLVSLSGTVCNSRRADVIIAYHFPKPTTFRVG